MFKSVLARWGCGHTLSRVINESTVGNGMPACPFCRIAELENKKKQAEDFISLQTAEIKELEQERDRCLVIATKWCDRGHHDWQELLTYPRSAAENLSDYDQHNDKGDNSEKAGE